jgi:hypothetical protein
MRKHVLPPGPLGNLRTSLKTGSAVGGLFRRLVGTNLVKRAGIVAEPIQVAADTPVVRPYLVDDDPNTSRVLRSVV